MRAVLTILPGAQLDEDNYGQIIIYTDLSEAQDGTLKDFDAEDKLVDWNQLWI